MDTSQTADAARQALEKKAKRRAWITGFTPALYVLASGGVIAHAGLGGLAVLVIIYLPAIPLCALLLRLVLTPVYRTLLDKSANARLHKLLAGILAVAAVAFCGLLVKTIFFPYDTVNQAIRDIPEIEQYFIEHKDELKARRLQAENGDKFFSEFYPGYSGFLQIQFCYEAKRSVGMGYQSASCYRYALDDHWYIEIWLMAAH